jgi:hypothetical protein
MNQWDNDDLFREVRPDASSLAKYTPAASKRPVSSRTPHGEACVAISDFWADISWLVTIDSSSFTHVLCV